MNFFSQKCICGQVENGFDNTWWIFDNRPRNVCSTSEIVMESKKFSRSFLKMLQLTGAQNEFWQLLSKTFNKTRKTYARCPKMKEKICFDRKIFSHKCSNDHVKRYFAIAVGTILLEGQNYTAKVRQWWKNPKIRRRFMYLKMLVWSFRM